MVTDRSGSLRISSCRNRHSIGNFIACREHLYDQLALLTGWDSIQLNSVRKSDAYVSQCLTQHLYYLHLILARHPLNKTHLHLCLSALPSKASNSQELRHLDPLRFAIWNSQHVQRVPRLNRGGCSHATLSWNGSSSSCSRDFYPSNKSRGHSRSEMSSAAHNSVPRQEPQVPATSSRQSSSPCSSLHHGAASYHFLNVCEYKIGLEMIML